MDLANLITNIILMVIIIITYYFQRNKIDALKTSINSHKDVISAQKEIIDAMKKASDVIDVDKIQKYNDLLDDMRKKEMEQVRTAIEKETGEQIESLQQKHVNALKVASDRYFDLYEFAVLELYYVHPEDRRELVEKLKIESLRNDLLDKLPDVDDLWKKPSPYIGSIAMREVIQKYITNGNFKENR